MPLSRADADPTQNPKRGNLQTGHSKPTFRKNAEGLSAAVPSLRCIWLRTPAFLHARYLNFLHYTRPEGACQSFQLRENRENGSLVDVLSEKGKYLGTGFYSRQSKIRVRLISRNANDRFDEAFWERRLRYAWEYRKTVMGGDTGCCRIVFGEADGFPGLTVDRFSELLVAQVLSVGMERLKPRLFPLLVRILREDTVRLLTGHRQTGERQRAFSQWIGLEGFSYGNFLRVMVDPSLAFLPANVGEYGWDGWLGTYFANLPASGLTVLIFQNTRDTGTGRVTRCVRNLVVSALGGGMA